MVLKFRNDIQGIRGLAVLLVFIFHISGTTLSGGFIGVDIFFVISGYLITNILINKIDAQNLNLFDFYIGRIKRIAPLYYFQLIVVLLVAIFIYIPSDILLLRSDAVWASIFLSNKHLSETVTYFGPSSTENPLLHTWTLAIEMQFYFLLPIFLIVIKKKHISFFFIVLSLLLVAFSYYNSTFLLNKHSMYFSLFARVPEFLVGSLFAINHTKIQKIGIRFLNVISVVSLIVIVLCSVLFSETTNYPGIWVLLPCLATAFLLVNESNVINKSIFSNKIAVHLGQLSYSIYLWHWPIMALLRYYYNEYEFSFIQITSITVLTYLASYCSWHFIENYFRTMKIGKFVFQGGLVLISLLCLTFFLKQINSYFYPIPAMYSQPTFGLNSHSNSFKQVEFFGSAKSTDDSLLLIGDSHALIYKGILNTIGKRNDFNFRTITNDRYPNIPGLNRKDFPNDMLYKQYSDLIKDTNKEITRAKIIMVSSIWLSDIKSLPIALEKFLNNLDKSKVVIILPDYPVLDKNPIRINKSYLKKSNTQQYNPTTIKTSKDISTILNNYPNVSFLKINYESSFNDLPYNNDTLMYYDKGHLNYYGSQVFARKFELEFMRGFQKVVQKSNKNY
jgi:peptidoglycan/LPS O-acetylase OafA/YrhL